ncbi:hypothetical protein [Geopseudomonas aromaticivorans]
MMKEKFKGKISHALLKTNVAIGMAIMSLDASATNNLGTSVTSLKNNIADVPTLLLSGAQIFGLFAGWKAWDTWGKAQKGQDPSATPGKAAGWLVGGVGGYFLPDFIGMGGETFLPGVTG